MQHSEEPESRVILRRVSIALMWGACAGPAAILTLWCLRVPMGPPAALVVAILSVVLGRRYTPADRALLPIYARFALLVNNAMVALGCVWLMLRMVALRW